MGIIDAGVRAQLHVGMIALGNRDRRMQRASMSNY